MAKFVTVKEAPTEVGKDEFVIQKPNFIAEIEKQGAKSPKNKLVSRFHLRQIVDAIGQVYDPDNMTGWVVKTHNYEGRPYADNKELNDIVVEALSAGYPKVFDKYLEKQVKSRPAGTKLVYLVQSGLYSNPEEILYNNGLNEAGEENDKPRKVVGKPALTKEQAEHLKKS